MSSPVVFQNPVTTAFFPAASTVRVITPSPELAALPVGTVLPAVVFPPNDSGISIVTVVLPDGAEASFDIKSPRPVSVETPVTIKIATSDIKDGLSFKITFSAPLPDIKQVGRTLDTTVFPRTAAPDVSLPAPSDGVSVTVTAFPVLNIPESVAALADEIADAFPIPTAPFDAKTTIEIIANPLPSPQTQNPPPPSDNAVLLPEQAAKQTVPAMSDAPVFAVKATTVPPTTVLPSPPVEASVPQTPDASFIPAVESPPFDLDTPPVKAVFAYQSFTSSAPAAPAEPPRAVPTHSGEKATDQPVLPRKSEISSPAAVQTAPQTRLSDSPSAPPAVFKGVVFNPDNAADRPLIVTNAGVLRPEDPVFFPHLTPVFIKVLPSAPDVSTNFAPMPDLKDATAMRVLTSALESLRAVDEQAFESVKSVLPQVGGKLPALMLSYMNAAARGVPFADFIGEANIAALNKSEHGKAVLKTLEKEFSATPKKVSGGQSSWTGWDIPILSGTVVEPVSLYLQRPNGDETRRDKPFHKGADIRFVLDLNLTALGSFQLDGLARRKDRRFDLIVRHHDELPSVFDETVRGIFAQTLSALNYTGTVKVDRTDDFIVLAPDASENDTLKRGVLV